MKTTAHRAATLEQIAADIRRCATPQPSPARRLPTYERLLRLASRAHNHKLYGRLQAAQACKRAAERIIDGMED